MEDLAAKWSTFSLSERETTGFVLQRDQRSGEFLLAAHFLTPRFFEYGSNGEDFQTTLEIYQWFQNSKP